MQYGLSVSLWMLWVGVIPVAPALAGAGLDTGFWSMLVAALSFISAVLALGLFWGIQATHPLNGDDRER